MNCIFCRIVQRVELANIIYEDADIIAFDNIYPQAATHKLIIPRKHISTLNDIQPGDILLMGKLLERTQALAKQLGVDEDGYKVNINCNAGGGQEIFHIHLHLVAGKIYE